MLKLFLNNGYKYLKIKLDIFYSLDWFQIFMSWTDCIHNNIL
jgi:hypothetical protein